jgi:hypothetical protein
MNKRVGYSEVAKPDVVTYSSRPVYFILSRSTGTGIPKRPEVAYLV